MDFIELTAEQKKAWIETRSALMWTAPAFSHLLFSMLNPQNNELGAMFSKEFPIAATDGQNLVLNPDGFFPLPLQQRVFVVAHEILHCVFDHVGQMHRAKQQGTVKFKDGGQLPWVHELANIAMDYVINDILIKSNVGQFVPGGCHDVNIGTAEEAWTDVYRKVFKNSKITKVGSGSGSGAGNGSGMGQSFDQLLDPGATTGQQPAQAAQGRSQAAWDTAVAAAVQAAKMQGKLPGALERLFSEVLEPTVEWQEYIRAFFSRKVGSGSYDWRKPDKRLIQRDIYMPARSGSGCGEVVVAVDTSGSIGQRELDHFFGELSGILDDVRPSVVHLVWCDAQVHRVDEVEETADLGGLKPVGGGGTSFIPVFEWVDNAGVRPEALVYLTDGYGAFPPAEPSYPVIWGDIAGGVKYPFGEVVNIPIKQK